MRILPTVSLAVATSALAAAVLPLSLSAPPPAVRPAVANPRVIKALKTWLGNYFKGRYDMFFTADIEKKSVARAMGLEPRGIGGVMTHQRDLQSLLEYAIKEQANTGVLEMVVQVAAVGLDAGPYVPSMAPHQVQRLGEEYLDKFTSSQAEAWLLQAGRGEIKFTGKRGPASRAAALGALGRIGAPAFRPTLEQALAAEENAVRLAAAEGLATMAPEPSLQRLAAALIVESSDSVIEALVQAMENILAPKKGENLPAESLEAVGAATVSLGRAGWRADMALIRFLDRYRTARAIPKLIAILQRFLDEPDKIRSGELSGLLRHRTHEALVSMTGTLLPMDRPDLWREFWVREKDKFEIVAIKADQAPAAKGEGTTAKGFFGIPVEGTRVTFILDVSGSMDWDMPIERDPAGGGGEPGDTSRIAFARDRLLSAVDALPEITMFNLVTFGARVKSWQKELVPATSSNKKRFKKYLLKQHPMGGTNFWGGLAEGLKMKSLVYGDRYETYVDEIFVLSDGAPSVGDVINTGEILRLVTETNKFARVRINTVFISSPTNLRRPEVSPGSPFGPATLMKRMAEENGGVFREIK